MWGLPAPTSPSRHPSSVPGPRPRAGRFSGGSGEAHLPAQQHQAEAFPRLPCPYVHHRRPQRSQASSCEGPQAPRNDRAYQEHLTSPAARSTGGTMSKPLTREGLSFPRSSRLRRSSDFRRVQGRGYKVRRPSILVLWLPRRDHPVCRVGLTVSKKVGNAVVRNRVKRWLREAVRHELDGLPRPVDVVLIAHPRAAESGAEGLRAEVRGALRELASGRPQKRSPRRRGRGRASHRNKAGRSPTDSKSS